MNNKYEEMSDFEINYLVAEIATVGEVISKDDMWPTDNANAVQVIYKAGVSGERKDYCNNPADMWPIILENKITLGFHGAGVFATAGELDEFPWVKYDYVSQNKNPLRAAAIVFLMIKDGE